MLDGLPVHDPALLRSAVDVGRASSVAATSAGHWHYQTGELLRACAPLFSGDAIVRRNIDFWPHRDL